jgi:DNA primase
MLLDDAEDYYIWRLQVALNEDDITTIAGKKRVLNNLLPFIRRIPNLVERQDLIRRTAEALDINEEIISYEVRKSKNKDNNPVEYLEVKNIGYTDIEKSILYSMITDETSGRKICNEISAEEFVTSECREIFNAITQVLTTQEQFSIQKVMNLLSQEAKDIVSSLVLQEEKYSGENIQNCINRLKERMRMVKLKELQQLIAEKEKAGEKKELYHLLRLYHDLIGKR